VQALQAGIKCRVVIHHDPGSFCGNLRRFATWVP